MKVVPTPAALSMASSACSISIWFFSSSYFIFWRFFWLTGCLFLEAMASRSRNFLLALCKTISSSSFDSLLSCSASYFLRLAIVACSYSILDWTLRTSSSVCCDFAVKSSLNFWYFSVSSWNVFLPSSSLSFSMTMYSFKSSVSYVLLLIEIWAMRIFRDPSIKSRTVSFC